MSEGVNQIHRAINQVEQLDLFYSNVSMNRVVVAARDFADLLTRLADGSLAEAVAKDAYEVAGYTGSVSFYQLIIEAIVDAALGLQEDTNA